MASHPKRCHGLPTHVRNYANVPCGTVEVRATAHAGALVMAIFDSIFRHFISSLNPDDLSVTWIKAGALDFSSCLDPDGCLYELRALTSLTATDLNDIHCSLFKDCVKKTLTLAGHFDHEKPACEALRHLTRTLLLLSLTHSKMEICAACN